MLHTARSLRGMVTAPHHLAAEAGLSVLRDGGNAIEAMVAAAASCAVVYPHMNSLGGDGFWLIHLPGQRPIAIDASGPAGSAVTQEFYRAQGLDEIPMRGPLAVNTLAGTVAGWQAALEVSAEAGGRVPLGRLLEEAIGHGERGIPVTRSQHEMTAAKLGELVDQPGFADSFLVDGAPPAVGCVFRQPRLAASLAALAADGLESFYRGPLAERITRDLAAVGSPLKGADLAAYRAARVTPLELRLEAARVYNLPPPSQGLVSLAILGIFERLGLAEPESFAHLHGLVEATKIAFGLRDRLIGDPGAVPQGVQGQLTPERLAAAAKSIDPNYARSFGGEAHPGDTIWMGAIDEAGRAVSFIQSIYWEFGSGVVLGETGLLWQNRGASFRLEPGALRGLALGRKPFHTLNPALALFDDGRVLAYGAMGGEGQPQTQAAVFTRHAHFGQELQAAVTAPRWVLGRTWGTDHSNLRLESRFDPEVVAALSAAGHEVELVAGFSDAMGHAGALLLRPEGVIEGAGDPRSDGLAVGF